MSEPSVNTSLEVIGVRSRGRPSSFTQEIADEICERLADGESLLQICRDDRMPTRHTVNDWAMRDAQFFNQYMRAREMQADHESDAILEIADLTDFDTIRDEDGNERPNSEWIARTKIRIDTRKWRAERMNTRRWGAQVQHQHVVKEQAAELTPDDIPGALGFLARARLEGESK